MKKDENTNPSEPVSPETPETQATEPAPRAKRFSPAAMRENLNPITAAGVDRFQPRIPLRKPNEDVWIRVHPSEEYRTDSPVLEVKSKKELYLILPEFQFEVLHFMTTMRFYTYVDRDGNVGIWPCKIMGKDGRPMQCYETAMAAAEKAMESWVQIMWDGRVMDYTIRVASALKQDPLWPKEDFNTLWEKAFKDRMIDTEDHPVLKELSGRA